MKRLVARAERRWDSREPWYRPKPTPAVRAFTEAEFEEAIRPLAERMFREGVEYGHRLATAPEPQRVWRFADGLK